MIVTPDRITALRTRIESGEPVTQSDLNRLATLQALDLAAIGEEFARQAARSDEQSTEEFRQHLELL